MRQDKQENNDDLLGFDYFWDPTEEQLSTMSGILDGSISFVFTGIEGDTTDYEKMNRIIYL